MTSRDLLPPFDLELLDDFRTWSREFEPPLDASGVLTTRVKLAGAAAVADLMCPRLIEVRGCILLERAYSPENFEHWWTAQPGNITAIEHVINHVHLWDVFPPTGEDPTHISYRVVEQLAERMVLCWRAAAAAQFPDRTFIIEVEEDYGPTLTLVSA